MENTSSLWKWIGAAVLVVVLGLGIGYYASGPKPVSGANGQVATGDTPNSDQPAPTASADPAKRPTLPVGQYLAKGAPAIQIEESAPDPNAKKATTAKPAVPTTSPATTPPVTPQTSLPTDSAPATSANDPNATPTAPAPSSAQPDAATPQPPTPAAPQPMPASALPTQPAPPSATPDAPLYHVLVGTTFTSEKSARIFAADLRHRGFMAMTTSVSSDTGVVYKVQIGAYRNRLAAEEEANQLQQSGYPAYIATDR